MNKQNDFSNGLNILSIILALENLQENRQQSKQNDVQAANDKQAKELLATINEQFEKQNVMLEKIIAQSAEIKHEKWILHDSFNCKCSGCLESALYDGTGEYILSDYCPHCGAKMDAKD